MLSNKNKQGSWHIRCSSCTVRVCFTKWWQSQLFIIVRAVGTSKKYHEILYWLSPATGCSMSKSICVGSVEATFTSKINDSSHDSRKKSPRVWKINCSGWLIELSSHRSSLRCWSVSPWCMLKWQREVTNFWMD